VAAGNTDTINGFYQSRTEMGMGRKHQHQIIRKQYQTGAAAANRFYEMYRVLRPNKGLVAFEMRGSRDGGGLEARAAPTRHRACPLACYLPPAGMLHATRWHVTCHPRRLRCSPAAYHP
jgi:hypothetical protein